MIGLENQNKLIDHILNQIRTAPNNYQAIQFIPFIKITTNNRAHDFTSTHNGRGLSIMWDGIKLEIIKKENQWEVLVDNELADVIYYS